MYTSFLADPTWERLGFENPPDETQAGKGIGIVITDTVINHPMINHLAGRLKKVTVNDDMSIVCHDVVMDESQEIAPFSNTAEHGMSSLFLLSHLPFKLNKKKYVGLVPQATFIMVDTHNPILLKKAMEWISEKRDIWNVKIVINLLIAGGHMGIRPTAEEPIVQAMMPAIESGLLVIQANGNSPAIINNSPIDFFAVGGYDDGGLVNQPITIHPSSSEGKNGDGHLRPDILAPFTYLPVPYYECRNSDLYTPYSDPSKTDMKLSYFGGTCGAATLIGGICAFFFGRYPDLSMNTLRNALIQCGTALPHTRSLAPAVDVPRTLNAISKGKVISTLQKYLKQNMNPEENNTSHSVDEIERGIALTNLIEQEKIDREELWNLVNDASFYVQKIAIWGLHKPANNTEREKARNYFADSPLNGLGVREAWAYMLLFGANKEELNYWMTLITDSSIDIRLCVKHFLMKYFPNAPSLDHTPDTNDEVIQKNAIPVQQWYLNEINCS